MHMNDYQRLAIRTAKGTYGQLSPLTYYVMGLAGEAGEVANALKKYHRDSDPDRLSDVVDELGDCLWYIAMAARECGVSLENIAEDNLEKLRARHLPVVQSEAVGK